MYNSFYGFQEKPFNLTPDPAFLYLSSVHKRALAFLTYGLADRKGFITITGEIGAGKTTLIRALLKDLDPDINVSKVINTKVNSLQLLKMILRDFSLDVRSDNKEDLLEDLNNFLLNEYAAGHSSVLIIDEAQNLKPGALEEIRLLSNLETDKDKLLQIILAGQPELREMLSLSELKQLKQRITVSYHMNALSKEEVSQYIIHRLKVAGAADPDSIMTERARARIYTPSGGIPRLINIICDAALVTGFVDEIKQLDVDLIDSVVRELDMDNNIASDKTEPLLLLDHDDGSLQDLSRKFSLFIKRQQDKEDQEKLQFNEQRKLFQQQQKLLDRTLNMLNRLEENLQEREKQSN
ncbi:MAG: XrtA/PEP-CTERM system-associated ATPase [bacterium]